MEPGAGGLRQQKNKAVSLDGRTVAAAPRWPTIFRPVERSAPNVAPSARLARGHRARYTRTAKEHGALAKQVKPYLEYKKVAEDLAQAEELAAAEADPEMKRYAEQELADLRARQHGVEVVIGHDIDDLANLDAPPIGVARNDL